MATETTTFESTTNKSVEERLEEFRLEEPSRQSKVAEHVETSAMPETEKATVKGEVSHQKETLKEDVSPPKESSKEEVTPRVTENETLPEQKTPELTERRILTEQRIPDETPKEQDTPAVTEKDTLKGREIPQTAGQETLQEEGTPKALEKDSLAKQEAPETIEKETLKEQEVPKNKDRAPAEGTGEKVQKAVEEGRPTKEASESVEEKELKIAEGREVAVATVDRRSGAGDENKTEDVPTTVVHEVQDGAKPSQSRASNIFHNVGSKMMQSVQKMKNAITGKSSK